MAKKQVTDVEFVPLMDLSDTIEELMDRTGLCKQSVQQRLDKFQVWFDDKKIKWAPKVYPQKQRGRQPQGQAHFDELNDVMERVQRGQNVEV